jgi:hypothetical protein
MSTLPAPSPELIRTLLERLALLEVRLERIEARVPEREPAETPRVGHPDEPWMKLRALRDFDRQERLQELRENPGRLAAIRERRAAMNQFYVSRGLTPDPDPYPELP